VLAQPARPVSGSSTFLETLATHSREVCEPWAMSKVGTARRLRNW
jgi:hypothetical protein